MFFLFCPRNINIDDIYEVECCNDMEYVTIDGVVIYNAVNSLFRYGEMSFIGNIAVGNHAFVFSSEQNLSIYPPKYERPSKYTFFLIKDNIGDNIADFLGADFIVGEYDKHTMNISLSYSDSQGQSEVLYLNRREVQ